MKKTQVQNITIKEDQAGQRLDNYLFTLLKTVPKTRIYRIIRKGEVRANKKRIKQTYRLQAGDIIRIPPLEIAEKPQKPQPGQSVIKFLATRVLFEDENLLIINKPAGIPVHGGSNVAIGIIEALRFMKPELDGLELAHRLDKDTSGCLLIAKKRKILKELHELLRNGEVKKIYHALTKGHWKKTALRVDAPLHKNVLKSGERIVRVDDEGKNSVSTFKVLKKYTASSLMEVLLETGRTHQIRVHAQYRRHSIACDDKYGDKEFNKSIRETGLKRLFLHAYSLEFSLPSYDKPIKITAPLDKDLADCLKALE